MEQPMAMAIAGDMQQIADRDLPWEMLAGQRVLVTGAGGFLGNYFVRFLLALHELGKVSEPVRVVAVVRDAVRGSCRFSDLMERHDFSLTTWDFSQIALPDTAGADYVIHAASQASPRYYGVDPVGTLLPNTVGTAGLLTALTRTGNVKGFLFISTSEVYGSVSGDVPLRETDYGVVDPATVRACYAESKRAGEVMCVAWLQQYGLPAFIARPFHTYGPGLAQDDGRVFADFFFNVVRGEDIQMKSDGSARRAFCYVTDAIAGFFTILLKGRPGEPYNVANPAGELSVLELAELLVGLRPDKRLRVIRQSPTVGRYIPSEYNRLVPDVRRLESLGWQARVSPLEGFRRMLEASR